MPPKPEETPEEKARKAKEKAERKAAFEAKRAAQLATEGSKADEGKSKADLRKERRAMQDAQRAAKQQQPDASKQVKKVDTETKPEAKTNVLKEGPSKSVDIKRIELKQAEAIGQVMKGIGDLQLEGRGSKEPSPVHESLARQIPTRHKNVDELVKGLGHKGLKIHPSFIRAGLRMNHGTIRGSELRTVSMLAAVKDVIRDYVTPSQKELIRDLISRLRANVKFLNECRPLSVGMNTAFEYIQLQATAIDPKVSDVKAKEILLSSIEEYERNEINLAMKGLVNETLAKIRNHGECIMIYGFSIKVLHVLYEAYLQRKQLKVIVVDCGPEYHGVEALEFLMKLDIPVTYIYINHIPFVLGEVTKVLLAGKAVLANGYVLCQTGSSQLAMLATTHNVPVFLLCQTSEFTDAVYTDAFLYNEARLPQEFYSVKNERLREYFSGTSKPPSPNLQVMHLMNDITPCNFISVMITENGVVPVNSVAAVIRRQVVTQKVV